MAERHYAGRLDGCFQCGGNLAVRAGVVFCGLCGMPQGRNLGPVRPGPTDEATGAGRLPAPQAEPTPPVVPGRHGPRKQRR